MVYKLTSVKSVIAKVFSDLDLKEGDHRVTDMIEWAGEAMAKIGAFPSLINKVTGKDDTPIIELSDYRAKLPCDLHKIIQVAYSTAEDGPFYPMRYATGSMDWGRVLNTDSSDTDADTTTQPTSDVVTLAMSLYPNPMKTAWSWISACPRAPPLNEPTG